MGPDPIKIKYSMKGEHLVRPLIRYFYAPIARKFLYAIALLRLPVFLVNLFVLIFSIIAAGIILFYPEYMFAAGILIVVAFIFDLCDGAWAKYSNKRSTYGKWFDETNGLIGVFLIFLAGAWIHFQINESPIIFVLFGVALFAFMMMNYAAVFSKSIQKDVIDNSLSEIFIDTLSNKTKINHNYLSFSFEYQWTLLAILVALNQFEILFWTFIILGNLQWMSKYLILSKR